MASIAVLGVGMALIRALLTPLRGATIVVSLASSALMWTVGSRCSKEGYQR